MKIIRCLAICAMVVAFFTQCTLEKFNDLSFLQSATNPDKVSALIDITTDNSGNVTITPGGEGAASYDVYFGDTTTLPVNVKPGGKVTHKYAEGSYTVKVVSKGVSGLTKEESFPITVTYRAPENLEVTFTKKMHNLKVKAKADYAASFLVYFGEDANEQAIPLATGGEVEHNYAKSGTYNVKVVALSGGKATAEKITEVKIFDAFELPITFENPNVNYFFGTFGNAAFQSGVNNPSASGINTSAKVGKYTKSSGAETWSGTYSPMDNPIDFSKGNKVKMLVYADAALVGKTINVELEWAVGGTPANGVAVLKVPILQANTWHELVFDYSGNAAIPATAKFTQLVLRFDDAKKGAGEVFYIDDIRLTY